MSVACPGWTSAISLISPTPAGTYETVMPEISVENIREAGVVGAGGAGFPTHVKLSAHADTVLVNAAECEPLFHKDKELLRAFPDAVLAGLAAAMRLVGAKKGVVGIKEKYAEVIDLVQSRLGSGMEIVPLRDVYPAGDEFILVYDALGRVVPPGGIPLDVGAVVINGRLAYVEAALTVLIGQVLHRNFSDTERIFDLGREHAYDCSSRFL